MQQSLSAHVKHSFLKAKETALPLIAPKFKQHSLKLSKKQNRYSYLNFPLWLGCEVSARAMGKKHLPPRENTRRCYEKFFDPLCAHTGVWPDYTEGHYPEGNEGYEEAKDKQFRYILDACQTKAGQKVLDIGCGNGKLMLMAKERGCDVTGVTVSREQARACKDAGLEVEICSFEQLPKVLPKNSFDAIVLNGPTEHFVTEKQALKGEAEAIRQTLFKVCQYLLKPQGKLFITCIHFRHSTNIHEAVKFPLLHQRGSYYFQCSVLIRLYSGWYPKEGTYERIASKHGLNLVHSRDATEDYLRTSLNWGKRLRSYVKDNPEFTREFLKELFLHDPRYFFITYLYWVYDPWTWQFRGADKSPMIHKWLMFEKSTSHA